MVSPVFDGEKGLYDLNGLGDVGEGFDYGVNGGGEIDVDKLFGDYENILEQGAVGTWP